MIYTSISHEFWAASIPMINHLQNVKGEQYLKKRFKCYFISFFILYNILPFILTLIFQRLDSFGQNNLYCWVKQPNGSFSKELVIQVVIFIFRWFNIGFCIVYTIKIILFLCSFKSTSKEEDNTKRSYSLRMLLFPFIQVFGEILPVTYRGLLWINSSFSVSWMQNAIVILGSLQSILYPICYCFHAGMFTYIHQSCHKNYNNDITIHTINMITDEMQFEKDEETNASLEII